MHCAHSRQIIKHLSCNSMCIKQTRCLITRPLSQNAMNTCSQRSKSLKCAYEISVPHILWFQGPTASMMWHFDSGDRKSFSMFFIQWNNSQSCMTMPSHHRFHSWCICLQAFTNFCLWRKITHKLYVNNYGKHLNVHYVLYVHFFKAISKQQREIERVRTRRQREREREEGRERERQSKSRYRKNRERIMHGDRSTS